MLTFLHKSGGAKAPLAPPSARSLSDDNISLANFFLFERRRTEKFLQKLIGNALPSGGKGKPVWATSVFNFV